MQKYIPLIDIVLALSSAIDLIDPNITDHHKRVAYIGYSLAKEMGLTDEEIKDITIAGLLHDCGAVNVSERSLLFEFDFGVSADERNSHGYKGWVILRDADELKSAAEIIKYHHVLWEEETRRLLDSHKIPLGSYILHLADRVDILINRNKEILSQRFSIIKAINGANGTMFMPKVVDAFNSLVIKPYFWFDIVSPYLYEFTKKNLSYYKVLITSSTLLQYANVAHRIIDYRSKFTATHSIGVATSASTLAAKFAFTSEDTELMHSAGLMHDLGKLCIAEDVLEKPAALDEHEFNLIKSHTYHTYRILNSIPGLDKVRDWAAFHHEKLDGSGYPFALKGDQLDLGSRILAVSDIFTALTEDRPYRKSLPLDAAMKIINGIKALDQDVVAALNRHLEEINDIRRVSQENAMRNINHIFDKV